MRRRARLVAGIGLVLLQLAIALTGNYGFFNLLTVVLCFSCFDDAVLGRCIPRRWRWAQESVAAEKDAPIPSRTLLARVGARVKLPAALGLALLGGVESWARLDRSQGFPDWIERARAHVAPFNSINAYGLFAVMTSERREIELEGSLDGAVWKAYGFRWKPGDPRRRPGFTGPHMPRLDWRMWFAALSDWRRTPWFHAFQRSLLRGEDAVEALLETNPFAEEPPRYLRATYQRYRFTTTRERRESGAWWRPEAGGAYSPVLTLDARGDLEVAR
jgi:hypothetical protein